MSFNQSKHLAKIRAATIERHRKEKLNNRNIMNCGIWATVIDYQNSDNITVKFDDGAIVAHRKYVDFKKGNIRNPNRKKQHNL